MRLSKQEKERIDKNLAHYKQQMIKAYNKKEVGICPLCGNKVFKFTTMLNETFYVCDNCDKDFTKSQIFGKKTSTQMKKEIATIIKI